MLGGIGTDRAEAERFIEEVRTKNHAFYGTDRGQGALKDLQQTFPRPWLYVGELLQNAVDAGAKRIRLAVSADSRSLVVEHDGEPFNEDHVEALCVRGMSTKGAGTVGFMGIGFKAVFQSFECVDVSSGPWRFGFCVKEIIGEFGDRQRNWMGCVLPEYSEHIDLPSPGMTCRFVLHERLARLGPIEDDVNKVLSADLLVLALLARRRVEELEWNGQRWVLSQSEQPFDDQTIRVALTACHDGSERVQQWVLFCAKYQPSRAAIARFLEHRQIHPKPGEREAVYAEAQRERYVEVFCPVDKGGIPEPPRRGQAFALLPTGVTLPLGLHVQADWLLVTSRRELMEVETNEWHREILARLAGLLRSYLQWLVRLSGIPERRLAEAYAVLPDWSETEGAFVTYLRDPGFQESLRAALLSLAFLPVRARDGVHFATPAEGRLLPSGLRVFDDMQMLPWKLFGDDVISATLLAARALESLEGLELLQPLAVDDLVTWWNSGMVGTWREELGSGGTDAHLKLIRALASLDDNAAWREAPLRCLPSSDGGWVDRQHAVGLPAEWDSVPEQDPPLRSWLEPFVAPSEYRLDWSFDRALRRDTAAQQYIAGVNRNRLDEVLRGWWTALPDTPDEDACTRVLDVTCWVLMKQRQRPGLVMQALCENGTLASFDHVVLADPYASNARRCFFQDHQAVSDRYLLYKPGLSDADWRSFFESASKAINGPFRLTTSARQLTQGELRKTLPDYEPPYTKAVPINTRWEEWSLHSENYLLIDATLPQELATALAAGMTPDEGRDAGLWLNEARQDLPSNARLRVAYVPYGCGFVSVDQTKFLASWVQVLQDARWVCATKGGGPHAPASVLARGDPARPDAPVASLPEELVKTLASCGISFGSSIPGVTSIERLRREAPSADAARLVQLLETAIGDAQNEPKRQEELEHVLRTCAFVPLKESGQLIDRAGRVSAERLVQRSARGAELGRWLLSIDAATKGLGDDDAYARLLRLIASVCAVPDAPTWEQALAFVQWVWEVRPDAELVRRTLPRAYRLIAEDMNADPARVEKWDQSRAHANVYVATREWVSVLADDLFLDDLGDERLKGMVGKLLLATPGHLGETVEEQLRVASLLGISRLSTRFQVALRLEGEKPLPAAWAGRLGEIVTLVQSYAQEEDGAGAPADPPIVSYYQRISKSLVGNGAKTNAWEVHAARDGARVCLSGEPDDFAAHLCRVLLQWAGLTSRRDLDELAPTLTQLIGWMDRLEKFVPRLEQLRTQLELQPSLASVPPPTDITSLTRPKLEPTGLSSKPTDSALEPLAQPPSSPTTPLGSTPPGSTTDAPQSGGRDGETGSSVEDRKGQDLVPPPPSGGYTSDDRERRLQAVRKRRAEFEAQEGELLGVGPLPDDGNHAAEHSDERSKKFGSDVAFREAALEYERLWDRYPVAKDANQPGHDIDSFDKPLEGSDRRLVRRIEVKGRGSKWEDDETVELSDRQFLDALTIKSEGVSLADDFDYWLYVVERWEDGALHVLPIRNPAKRAAKFEFRGGTWRALADEDTHSPGPYGCFRMDSD